MNCLMFFEIIYMILLNIHELYRGKKSKSIQDTKKTTWGLQCSSEFSCGKLPFFEIPYMILFKIIKVFWMNFARRCVARTRRVKKSKSMQDTSKNIDF